ncbi:MAG: hypothetical protein ACREB8_05065, partial [Pseudolabrys sp.]
MGGGTMVVELQRDADHIIALGFEQRRGHRGVDPAGHGDDDSGILRAVVEIEAVWHGWLLTTGGDAWRAIEACRPGKYCRRASRHCRAARRRQLWNSRQAFDYNDVLWAKTLAWRLQTERRISGDLAVPPVASEATSHAPKPTLPNPARAAQTSDRAQESPFASLLDTGTPASGDQPPQTPAAPGDQPPQSPTGIVKQIAPKPWPHLAQLPVVASDAVQINSDAAQPDGDTDAATTSIAAAVVAVVGAGKTIGTIKSKTEVKTTASSAAGDDNKPAGDGKPARDGKPAGDSKSVDGLTPVDPAAVAASDPIQAIIPLVAAVPAPALGTLAPAAPDATPQPTPDGLAQAVAAAIPQAVAATVPQVVAATVPQAVVAAKGAATVAIATPKTKSAKLVAAQTDNNEPAAASDSSVKTASAPKGDGKPQPAADAADKPGIDRAHTD